MKAKQLNLKSSIPLRKSYFPLLSLKFLNKHVIQFVNARGMFWESVSTTYIQF